MLGDWGNSAIDTLANTRSRDAVNCRFSVPIISPTEKHVEYKATLSNDCRCKHRTSHTLPSPAPVPKVLCSSKSKVEL
ncbi:unnamed protein product [Oppiella nova]|uniref:Uncharacterized protein n=1 Tax=Oppiella nova TaxID=334625 RepID=A0A7R9LWL6_9ACAR|nr:unnamed protein product [Oppiella nova]CAG2166985.1 unnamed protein product [Oppiella nova]